MEKPTVNIDLQIKQTVSVDFLDILVKMVDHVREGGYSADAKIDAVRGLEMVVRAVKTKSGSRSISGMGSKEIPSREILPGVVKKINGGD